MVMIPENVLAAFNDPNAVKVMTTVGADGQPHSIVCGSIRAAAADTIIVGEILMKTSSANLGKNDKAAFLALVGKASYVVNVKVKQRVAEGPMLDNMNQVLAGMGLKASAVWVFTPTAVFDQSAGPAAGTKIA
ncbi:MAG: pyridoxamine 5'-phosphate oxidase family protein [Methanomassiliicoccaceae archaeon]|nr:pyridoxamine 5'-phosphate oxidase family protein [Methanomassiliicoccaceae archaeon]